jgi:hypothetical protein
VGTQEGPHNVQNHSAEDAIGVLSSIASSIAQIGSNSATSRTTECYVVLGPEHAATVAGDGWTREDVQLFLYERARVPWREMHPGKTDPTDTNSSERPWRVGRTVDDLVPVVHDPDRFRVMVGGGAGKHSAVLHSGAWRSAIVPFELPQTSGM